MPRLLKTLQANLLPGTASRRNQFRHSSAFPRLARIYLIDAHSSLGFKFRRKRQDFPYLGSPQYGKLDNDGNFVAGFYEKTGWGNSGKLPLTGFKPLLDGKEAEKFREEIRKEITASNPGAHFGIEAIDCILTLADAKWLVRLKQEYGVHAKAQLTYNHQNHLATGCRTWDEPEQRYAKTGLSSLGKEMAEALMQGGIIVDVSHLNKQSLLDVCEIGKRINKPVIASHSNTLQVFSQGGDQAALKATNRFAVRCLDDEEIKAIISTGGYIGLTPTPWFLSIESSKWAVDTYAAKDTGRPVTEDPDKISGRTKTIMLLVSHISHVRQIASDFRFNMMRNSVALASDVEWVAKETLVMPRGYTKGSYKGIFSDLDRELRREGWTEEDLAALFHGNVERVFQ